MKRAVSVLVSIPSGLATYKQQIMRALMLVVVTLLLCSHVTADNLYIDSSASDNNDENGSEEYPFLSISKAMSQAKTGDTLLIKRGIGYTGSDNMGVCSSPLGVADKSNCTASGLTLRGLGDPKDIVWYMTPAVFAQRALAIDSNTITYMSNMTVTGFYYHPKYSNQVTNLRLAGGAIIVTNSAVTFENMIFANNSAAEGGSVGISKSNITIINSLFEDNQALVSGGALSSEGGNLHVHKTSFFRNKATGNPATQSFGNGGALVARGAVRDLYEITGSAFVNNTAAEAGGAVHIASVNLKEKSLLFMDIRFYGNTATGSGSCVSSSACEVRGGALFISAPGAELYGCKFADNRASTLIASQSAEGGAMYSTDVYELNQFGLVTLLEDCTFTNNSASAYGGGAYILNQYLQVNGTDFRINSAGRRNDLFADSSSAGGGLWFSGLGSHANILRSTFENNYVWGGWGGAIFITDSPHTFEVNDCNFTRNNAFSSYTFSAQGGAIMVSHNTIFRMNYVNLVNNTATPRVDVGDGPLTLSGSGGAVYVQSANVTIQHSYYAGNLVLTGQFDSGSEGGAVLLEDCVDSEISMSQFFQNGAAGYIGFSTFASSGAAGAVMLKFSAATIKECFFSKNWVSVGGTKLSNGGAIAIYFDYSSDGIQDERGVIMKDSEFEENVAYSSICSNTGSKSGSGGAISIIGSAYPGVIIDKVALRRNYAISRQGILVLSYGGGMSVSVGSNVTGLRMEFESNFAVDGLGNDISVLGGDASSSDNNVYFRDSVFNTSLTVGQIYLIKERVQRQAADLCFELKEILQGKFITDLGIEAFAFPDNQVKKRSILRAKSKAYHFKIAHNRRSEKPRHPTLYTRSLQELFDESIDEDLNGFSEMNSEVHNSRSTLHERNLMVEQIHGVNIPSFYHYPSTLVVTGKAVFFNPTFIGNYRVFFGDFLELLLEGEVASRNGCEVFIFGNVTQEELAITAFRADMSIFDNKRRVFEFERLMMFNATLNVANDVIVHGNSSVVDSVIRKDGTVHNPLMKKEPTLKFYSALYTGFDLLDFDVVNEINAVTIQKILTFDPLFVLDGCMVEIMDSMYLNTPRVAETIPQDKTLVFKLLLLNDALFNITRNATMHVLSMVRVTAENRSKVAIYNEGTIFLDGAKHTLAERVDPDDNKLYTDDDDASSKKFKKNTLNSLSSVLTIEGQLQQIHNGKTYITLNRTSQDVPVLNLDSNETFLGQLKVRFEGRPDIDFYDTDLISSWKLVSYQEAKQNSLGSAQLEAPFGLGFDKISEPVYNATLNTTIFYDTYEISSMSCADSISFSAQGNQDNAYPCFLCLSNSSCSYCNNNKCANSEGGCLESGVMFESTCCKDNCNAPQGKCVSHNDNTAFSCECNSFFTGETCRELSNITIVMITLTGALALVISILVYNYRASRGKKTRVLEELRQGLLYDHDSGNGNNLDNINEAYIQSLQQGLILKDVSVKFKEIDIEKQVGEGSFGVVYKATFRGASVAVKRMRPVFTELTNKDIEEFNKEAYMMSRLRHPNIVLVMGISYVEPEILKFPKKSRFNNGATDDDADAFSSKTSGPKAPLQKTVCIVTEYLEQGSLADILYGPQRLPAEIWTYDLILTCALQAARGMLYLHSHSPPICHRDLKSSNLVVDDHWVVKVTDFGMSRIIPEKVIDIESGTHEVKTEEDRILQKRLDRERLSSAPDYAGRESIGDGSDITSVGSLGSYHSANKLPDPIDISSVGDSSRRKGGTKDRHGQEMTSNLGTTAWCAPELLVTSSKARYSVKVDVYSFGMVLWELWERKRPYNELSSRFDIMDAIRSGTRPVISPSCPPALQSLIQRCWQGDPIRRPMFQYIVRYLKDELARVRRSRERLSSVESRSSEGLHRAISGNGLASHTTLGTASGQADTMFGKIAGGLSSMLPSRDANESAGWAHDSQTERINIPSEAANVRTPLYANPDINYLAASPAVNQGLMSRLQNTPSVLFGQQAYKPPTPSHASTEEDTRQGVVPPQQLPSQNSVPTLTPNLAPRFSARDKYVMKMSGWQPSQPDAGLPPSAGGIPFSRSMDNTSYLTNQVIADDDNSSRFFAAGEMEEGDDTQASSPPGRRLPSNHSEY